MSKTIVLLFGAFAFAFLLGETLHELGHFAVERLNGNEAAEVVLDPFGGSRITSGEAEGWAPAAGPLLNVAAGLLLFAALWRFRRPFLLPFLLAGPVSLIQEGVTFSLGMLTPGGDADLIARQGAPDGLLLLAGIVCLAAGILLLAGTLPVAGIGVVESFGRKFGLVLGGMGSFMFVRFLAAGIANEGGAREQAITLLFALILALLVAVVYRPGSGVLFRLNAARAAQVTWRAAAVAVVLGVGIASLQLAV